MSQKQIPNGSTETRARDQRVATVVPPDASPTRCPYCGRPFPTEQLCTLHLGERHRTEWTEEERERYESAYDTETNELFIFHLKVIGALVVTFFSFTYTYVFVWS